MKNKIFTLLALFAVLNGQIFAADVKPPRWLTIAAADAAGGFVGACEGSVFGPWGSAAGGLICGAAGSIGAASRVAPPLPFPTGPGPYIPEYPENDLFYLAVRHNTILGNYLSTHSRIEDMSTLVNYSEEQTQGFGMQTEGLNLNLLTSKAQEVANSNMEDAQTLCNYFNRYLTDPHSKVVMNEAAGIIYGCTDYGRLFDWLRGPGKTILLDTRIPQQDKVAIKVFLAILEGSGKYWSTNLK